MIGIFKQRDMSLKLDKKGQRFHLIFFTLDTCSK